MSAQVGPRELAIWLVECVSRIRDAWLDDFRSRDVGRGSQADQLVQSFAEVLVPVLPVMMGPYRLQVEPLWDRGWSLFGAVGAKRGLAAGEIVEELQMLREQVIRELYRNPPLGGAAPLPLRELLRLTRALDRAVTHASVGHTDALFFDFFGEDGGTPLLSGADVATEAKHQIDELERELQEMILLDGALELSGGT